MSKKAEQAYNDDAPQNWDESDEFFAAKADNAYAEAMADMPPSELLIDTDLNTMAEHYEQIQRLMKMFPMFFTARGNTLPPASGKKLVVTGKNFVTLSDAIADLKLNVRNGAMLVVRSDAWSLMISAPASKAFCDTGLLDAIFLAGWTVQSLNNG